MLDKDNKIVKEKREITKINIVKKYLFISFVSKLILEKNKFIHKYIFWPTKRKNLINRIFSQRIYF